MKKLALIPLFFALLVPLKVQALQMSEITPGGSGGMVAGVATSALPVRSAVVLNQITGEVLFSQNADVSWEPASLTKLLTALVVLDLKPDFNKRCYIAREDEATGAQLANAPNGVYKLGDLFSAMLVGSANDAAKALANQCAGVSTTEFMKRMNEKARSIGALNSYFSEPSGLDDSNRTTALDMAKIANTALSTLTIRDYAKQQTITFSSLSSPIKTHVIASTSKSLFTDPGFSLIAGKTGYLNNYNYASSTTNGNGKYLITVVLGSPTQQASFDSTKSIAALGFDKLNTNKVVATANR